MPEGDPQKKDGPFHFSLNNIRIDGGSLDFWDGPKKTQHTVRELKVAIPFISNMDYLIHQFTEPVLSATVNGNPYLLQGRTKPFRGLPGNHFDIDIKDINLPYYLAYAPVDLNFKLLSGTVDTKLRISFTQFNDKKHSLSVKGDVASNNLPSTTKRDFLSSGCRR